MKNELHKTWWFWLTAIVFLVAAFFIFNNSTFWKATDNGDVSSEDVEHIESKSDLIVVETPEPLSVISSPVTIEGKARGSWYFEADFPVNIVDADGNILGEHYATAQDEWMTTEFVPFESKVEFEDPNTETGEIILEKANPSGLPENADELRIPIKFGSDNESQQRTVDIYYYNPDKDTDETGNIMCSEDGLVSVERMMPVTETPIQDTINILLQGELTEEEKARGVTTEFPLEGLSLEGASLQDGVLTLEFNDPNHATSGGSCRAGILWFQIRETALQFDEVSEVQFQPEELFQP